MEKAIVFRGLVTVGPVSNALTKQTVLSFPPINDRASNSAPFVVTASSNSPAPISFSLSGVDSDLIAGVAPTPDRSATITLQGGAGSLTIKADQLAIPGYTAASFSRTIQVVQGTNAPNPTYLLGGGRLVNGKYIPPDLTQIDWQTNGTIQATNGVGGELVISGNQRFLGDTSAVDTLFKVAINNGRRIVIAPGTNLASTDHIFHSEGNNGPVQFEATHSNFFLQAPTTVGEAKGRAVDISGCTNVKVKYCYVNGSGIKFGVVNDSQLELSNNFFEDVDGRRVGYNQNRIQWQGIQLVGDPNNRPKRVRLKARWNIHRNHPDRSRSEDNVNLYHVEFTTDSIMEYCWFDGAYNNAYDNPRRLYNADGSGYTGTLAISEESHNITFYRLFGRRAGNAGFSLDRSYNCVMEECWYVSGGRHREGVYAGQLIIDSNNGLVLVGGAGNLLKNNKSANMRFDKAYNEGKPESQWRLAGRNDGPDNGTYAVGTVEGNLRLRGPRTYSTLPTGNVHIPTEDDENEPFEAFEAHRAAFGQQIAPTA